MTNVKLVNPSARSQGPYQQTVLFITQGIVERMEKSCATSWSRFCTENLSTVEITDYPTLGKKNNLRD